MKCKYCKEEKPRLCDCEDCPECHKEECVVVIIDEAHDGIPTIGHHCYECDELW